MQSAVNSLVDGSLAKAALLLSDFSGMLALAFGLAVATAVIGIALSFFRS